MLSIFITQNFPFRFNGSKSRNDILTRRPSRSFLLSSQSHQGKEGEVSKLVSITLITWNMQHAVFQQLNKKNGLIVEWTYAAVVLQIIASCCE